jgi:hypothetical protein
MHFTVTFLLTDLYINSGGDGAHTGVAHEDFVDIRVAYIIVFVLFFLIIFLVMVLPNPVDVVAS